MLFYLVIFYMLMISIFLFILFLYFYLNQLIIYYELELIKISSLKFELLILLDWMMLLFSSVVLVISSMVVIYSMEYMKLDVYKNRFMMLVFMFVLSMLFMIMSPNLMSILVGWDGLGLVSYCLVIYYQSKSSFNSGMITVLTNRIGDIMILISIGLIMSMNSWNFMFWNDMEWYILFLLFIASITKSAQLPFSTWLPMAMAAPTPVSSLVHSSTLVTAGVYLMIRMNYLLNNIYLINLMMLISVMTMFMSGIGANLEFDLKKIIALSTLSQLGFMFFCLSMNMEEITFFHLIIHAMFKSMLFMCAGIIIHNMMGHQDTRFLGSIMIYLPMVSVIFNCSLLSLCGIPFMSGFYSKDLILEMFLMKSMYNKLIMIMVFISMGLTLMYSMRLIYYSFMKCSVLMIYEIDMLMSKNLMGKSLLILFMFSIIKGSMLSWLLFSDKYLIFLSYYYKLMIYYYLMIGMGFGLFLNKMFINQKYIFNLNFLINFLIKLWFMLMFYLYSNFKFFSFSIKIMKNLEVGWIEYIGGQFFLKFLLIMFKMDFFNKNYLYLVMFIMSIILLMMLN